MKPDQLKQKLIPHPSISESEKKKIRLKANGTTEVDGLPCPTCDQERTRNIRPENTS